MGADSHSAARQLHRAERTRAGERGDGRAHAVAASGGGSEPVGYRQRQLQGHGAGHRADRHTQARVNDLAVPWAELPPARREENRNWVRSQMRAVGGRRIPAHCARWRTAPRRPVPSAQGCRWRFDSPRACTGPCGRGKRCKAARGTGTSSTMRAVPERSAIPSSNRVTSR